MSEYTVTREAGRIEVRTTDDLSEEPVAVFNGTEGGAAFDVFVAGVTCASKWQVWDANAARYLTNLGAELDP